MCPSKNSRIINSLLARLHGAMSTQACLANTGGIMSLYMRHVSHQVQSGSEESSILYPLQAADSSTVYLYNYLFGL